MAGNLFSDTSSAGNRDAVLQTVARADQPLTAPEIVKRAGLSKQAARSVPGLLENLVQGGSLRSVPPKSAKGKPRYWDRDPLDVARNAVLAVVQQSEEPVAAGDVARRLKLPFKLSAAEVSRLLEETAGSGHVHTIAPRTAKGGPRYWHRDQREFAQRCIVRLLEDKGPQGEAAVKRAVKWLGGNQFRELIQELIATRTVFVHPPVGTSKKITYGCRPPSPMQYMVKLESALRTVVSQLKAAGVGDDALRQCILQMAETAGVSLGRQPSSVAPREPQREEIDLIAAMKRIESGAERGALITARDLRRAAGLGKAEFDRAALELARSGRLVLHQHDYPAGLTPAERDDLIADDRGNYYVGLALRPGQGAT